MIYFIIFKVPEKLLDCFSCFMNRSIFRNILHKDSIINRSIFINITFDIKFLLVSNKNIHITHHKECSCQRKCISNKTIALRGWWIKLSKEKDEIKRAKFLCWKTFSLFLNWFRISLPYQCCKNFTWSSRSN